MTAAKNITRRDLVKTAAAVAVGGVGFPYILTSSATGGFGAVAPSNRITVGCIGVGPQGSGVMSNFLAQKDAQVTAVCDVKSNVLSAAQQSVNAHYQNLDCKAYSDFRDLLRRDDIDAVLIATPDHWHVPVAITAAGAGKDIYLEKPMGLSLAEDHALQASVERYGTVFQFGTQQRSSRQFLHACQLVRNGYIGSLKTINVWSPGSASGGSSMPAPVPDWLDYQMWLGPAPFTPYTENRCSNQIWWYVSDYALGFIAGWGVHPLDIALWGGGDKVTGTLQIEGTGDFPADGVCDTAVNWNVVCRYETGVVLNFTGVPFPEQWQKRYGRTTGHGTAFEGTQGWVHVDREGINAEPAHLLEIKFGPNDVRLYASNHHVRNFLDCIKTRSKTICPVDEAVRVDTLCHLGNIATRLGRGLKWNPQMRQFVNDNHADRMLTRAMRAPWRI